MYGRTRDHVCPCYLYLEGDRFCLWYPVGKNRVCTGHRGRRLYILVCPRGRDCLFSATDCDSRALVHYGLEDHHCGCYCRIAFPSNGNRLISGCDEVTVSESVGAAALLGESLPFVVARLGVTGPDKGCL